LTKGGSATLILPTNRRGDAEMMSWLYPGHVRFWGGATPEDVLGWGGGDPVRLVCDTIQELGLEDKVIGIELNGELFPSRVNMSLAEHESIKGGLPRARFTDASSLVSKIRMIKSSGEIRYIREACRIACEAFQAGFESLREGMTQRELARAIFASMVKGGCENDPLRATLHMRSGKERASGCKPPTDAKFRKGDLIELDGGTNYRGYYSDIHRMACIGEPSKKQRKMFDVIVKSQNAAREALKPGASVREVASVAWEVVKKAGYERNITTTIIGHGLGLDIHEAPMLGALVPDIHLEPGMVLTIEPWIYDDSLVEFYKNGSVTGVDWEGGFEVENDILITNKGSETLTPGVEELYIAQI
jgi:Xaa-Pro aminopeptidase